MLTIVAPLEFELAGLRKGLSPASPDNPAKFDYGKSEVFLRAIGAGRQAARTGTKALLASRGFSSADESPGPPAPDSILLLGFAGAVDPSLRTGDLLLSHRYYLSQEDRLSREGRAPSVPLLPMDSTNKGVKYGANYRANYRANYIEPNDDLLDLARHALAATGLRVVATDGLTVDSPVDTAEAKADLGRRYRVGAVNMEDYWVAREARQADVPFLAVRAVLDTGDQHLPSYLMGLAAGGNGAALGALARFWRVPTLLRLACQMWLAQRRLTQFALCFIDRLNGDWARRHGGGTLGAAAVRPAAAGTQGMRFGG